MTTALSTEEDSEKGASRASHGAAVGPTAPPDAPLFSPADGPVTRESWERRGAALGRSASGISWQIGDWLLLGEREWGVTYTRAAEITSLAEPTLRNCRYVCQRFERPRRRDKLTFAHHAEVASLAPDRADELLARAEAEALPLRRLRELAARLRPVTALDPRAERVSAAIRGAVSLKKLAADLLPDADRVALERILDHLSQLAASPILDEDRASPDEVRALRSGWRRG